MKKSITILVLLALVAVKGVFAQTPQQFKYQAVLRDASNVIVASTAKTVVINILQGSASGSSVYQETHSITTTAQGVINLNIGGGTVNSGVFANIPWSTNPYWVKVTVDGVEISNGQLLSVPYALNAKYAESSNYNNLTNLPTLFDGTWTSLSGKPTFATVATSGSYADLTNKPSILNSQWTTTGSDIYYNTGNVGIGTTEPTSKLQINDGNVANGTNTQFAIYGGRTNTPNAEYANIFFGERSDGDGAGSKISSFTGNNNYETGLAFSTSKDISGSSGLTEAMRIGANGNVGIGTTTPAYKLDVAGAINGTSVLVNGVPVASSTDTYWSTAGAGKIQYSGGNVGIGVLNPAYNLDVAGDINITGNFRVNGSPLSGTGTVTSINASGGTTGLSFSGGAITSSGTLTMAGTLALTNGGTGSTTAAGARTNLGATTLGNSMFTLTNPSAITFPQFNANNTVSALTAAAFRTAIGAGTGSGTVTSVSGTLPISVATGTTTPVISISAATTSAAGSMSAADKTKLDGIATSANNYTHPTGDGNLHVIATGTTNNGKVLTAGSTAGSLSWTTPTTGTVTSVTGTSPISITNGTTTPAISLGIVPVANGGTGATTLTGYVKGSGTSAMTASSTIPVADISGTLPVANGGTGTTTGSITGTTALTFAAGGTNQNVNLTPTGTGDVVLNGYTRLGGSTAPAIKYKKFTGTLAPFTGDFVYINHGLTLSKILDFSGVFTLIDGTGKIPLNCSSNGHIETYMWVDGTKIGIMPVGTSAVNCPFTVIIMYEE